MLGLLWLPIHLAGQTNTNLSPVSYTGFIENKGQIVDQNNNPNPDVLYLLNTPGMNVQLRRGGWSYDLCSPSPDPSPIGEGIKGWGFHRIYFDLVGYNPDCKIITSDPSADYLNYYTTGTGKEGVTGVRHYARVTFKDIYPGIDLEFVTDSGSGYKYNFLVHPGGDVGSIRLNIKVPDKILFSGDTLRFITTLGGVDEVIPESYLQTEGSRTIVKVHFREISSGVYGFTIDEKIPENSTLVIDPTSSRLWGTYYGGSAWDFEAQCSVDQAGNVFLAGATLSLNNIATAGSYQSTLAGSYEGFLAKFNAAGQRQWGTYFGGTLKEELGSCVVGNDGSIYVSGDTKSACGIATAGAHQTAFGGGEYDCYIEKFNQAGNRLWGTYYGGAGSDSKGYMTADNNGNIFLTGSTDSDAGIASSGAWQPTRNGTKDAFLAKFNSSGARQWGTYYGGNYSDYAASCTTGQNNDIFIAGFTMSDLNISTPDAYQPAIGGSFDGFLVKFNAGGVRQLSTYYGGTLGDEFFKCSYIAHDTLYVSGWTLSETAIASPGAHQTLLGGTWDNMLIKFIECRPIAAAGPITGPSTVHRNSYGIQYSIPPLAHANYLWTLPPGATIAGIADTNCITVNFSGTASSGYMKVKGMNKCGQPGDSALLYITLLPEFFSVGFIAPDTTCINQTINILDTTTSGTTYYWNFCSGNTNADPTGINIGNPGGLLGMPTYPTLVKHNDSCFSFISCQGVGVIRYYHGSSFKNNPVSWTNLGTFGGLIGPSQEGIQVKLDNGNWYGFVNSNTTMIRLNFRSSPMNIPTATDIGPFPSFNMAHGLVVTKEGTNWIGLVTCTTGQKLIRLNFGNTLANNSPVVTDFGNLGGVLTSPSAICLAQENSLWYAMIMAGGNTLARIAFGTSLLNAPTGVNLGNPGGFNAAGGLTLLRDCESTTGYWTNGLANGELGRLTFPAGITGVVSGTVLGNIGGLNQPHSFSEIFRQNDTLYAYITDPGNATLTRLTFPPCNNASVPSSNLFTPPPYFPTINWGPTTSS